MEQIEIRHLTGAPKNNQLCESTKNKMIWARGEKV